MTSGLRGDGLSQSGGSGGGGGGGGGGYPPGGPTHDTAAGTTISPAANVVSWNISEPVSGANTYDLPVDTVPTAHNVTWKSGNAPTVTAPAGWVVSNPVNGSLASASYTYGFNGNGPVESYGWVSDPAEKVFYPIA